MTTKQRIFGVLLGLASVAPALAQEKPDLTLRYQELTQREQLQFSMKGHPDLSKPVGALSWDFPPTTFARVGFDPELKTFCMDPLTPVTSGMEYGFRIDTFGTPKDFGLADDEAGRKLAVRRARYVKELFGRYYGDTVRDPDISAAAFQTALWEVVQETELPDGPMPFNLYNGTFKVKAAPTDSPEYVQRAQRYVQSLTGDDASFNESPVLAGQNLVRLTGLRSGANAAAQSQLSLRSSGGGGSFPGQAQSIASTSTGAGGQQLPLGLLNSGLTGFNGYDQGQGQGGGAGGGFGGGNGGGFLGNGGGTTVNTGGDSGNTNPITPTDPTTPANIVINNNPVFNNNNNNENTNNNNPVNNNTNNNNPVNNNNNTNNNNQSQNQNQNQQQQQQQNQNQNQNQDQSQNQTNDPGDPNGGNNPIPAPPAAVLGMVALGMFGIRKLRGRMQNS